MEGALFLCSADDGCVPQGSGPILVLTPTFTVRYSFTTSCHVYVCTHVPIHIYRNPTHSGSYDLIVVGGGIVGMATAREVALRYPNMTVGLVEKENELGECVCVCV